MICYICKEEKENCKDCLYLKSFMMPLYGKFSNEEPDDSKFIYCAECLEIFEKIVEKQKEKK